MMELSVTVGLRVLALYLSQAKRKLMRLTKYRMVGLTILVIALGVANVVRANVSSKGSCSFKSSVSAAEISE